MYGILNKSSHGNLLNIMLMSLASSAVRLKSCKDSWIFLWSTVSVSEA